MKIFYLFSLKTGFDMSPVETTCMKCQIPFSGKNKKNNACTNILKQVVPILPGILILKYN